MRELAGIADAADENLAVHLTWGLQNVPGMRVQADEHLVMADCGLRTAVFNTASRTRFPRERTARGIEKARDWFGHGAVPFTWWVGPADYPVELGSALLDAGFRQAATDIAMVADPRQLAHAELAPLWLEIRRVVTLADLEAFAAIMATTMRPYDTAVHQFYELAAERMLQPTSPVRRYVGYLDGVPVATSELVITGRIAGLYSLATMEAHRGQGLATAMALSPMLEAANEGCIAVVADAEPDCERIFRRLGFDGVGERSRYHPSPPGEG